MNQSLIPYHEEQPTYYELRSQFREENLQRVLSMLRAKRTQAGPLQFKFLTDTIPSEDAFSPDMRFVGEQDFGLEDVPAQLAEYLAEKARETETFEALTLPPGEGYEHDGPSAEPIESMTEAEQIAYVDLAIECSREK